MEEENEPEPCKIDLNRHGTADDVKKTVYSSDQLPKLFLNFSEWIKHE